MMGDANLDSMEKHLTRVVLLCVPFFAPVYVLAFTVGRIGPVVLLSMFALIFAFFVFALPACLAPEERSRWRLAAIDASTPTFVTLAILMASVFSTARVGLWAGLAAGVAVSAFYVGLVQLYHRWIKKKARRVTEIDRD